MLPPRKGATSGWLGRGNAGLATGGLQPGVHMRTLRFQGKCLSNRPRPSAGRALAICIRAGCMAPFQGREARASRTGRSALVPLLLQLCTVRPRKGGACCPCCALCWEQTEQCMRMRFCAEYRGSTCLGGSLPNESHPPPLALVQEKMWPAGARWPGSADENSPRRVWQLAHAPWHPNECTRT